MTRNLPAGVYRFAMFASNTNGEGPDSDLTDPITVGERGAGGRAGVPIPGRAGSEPATGRSMA